MNAMQERLFFELRQTQAELEHSLNNKQKQDWFTKIVKEELADIKAALYKITEGSFGQCEISGELLPLDLLKTIPTLKSVKDSEKVDAFYRKPIHSPFR